MIAVPFFTEGIEGCTAVFKDVEMVAFEPVRVSDLTGPEIFVGIAKVVVFVTSPFAFVVTPGRGEGDKDAVEIGEGFGDKVATTLAKGVGEAVTTGSCERLGKGVGERVGVTEGDGDGVPRAATAGGTNPPPPPPPPKNPPPPPPPPPPPEDAVGVGVGVGVGLGEGGGAEALGVADDVALGAAVGVTLALAEAPKVSCPEIGDKTLSPTAFVA